MICQRLDPMLFRIRLDLLRVFDAVLLVIVLPHQILQVCNAFLLHLLGQIRVCGGVQIVPKAAGLEVLLRREDLIRTFLAVSAFVVLVQRLHVCHHRIPLRGTAVGAVRQIVHAVDFLLSVVKIDAVDILAGHTDVFPDFGPEQLPLRRVEFLQVEGFDFLLFQLAFLILFDLIQQDAHFIDRRSWFMITLIPAQVVYEARIEFVVVHDVEMIRRDLYSLLIDQLSFFVRFLVALVALSDLRLGDLQSFDGCIHFLFRQSAAAQSELQHGGVHIFDPLCHGSAHKPHVGRGGHHVVQILLLRGEARKGRIVVDTLYADDLAVLIQLKHQIAGVTVDVAADIVQHLQIAQLPQAFLAGARERILAHF